MKEKIPELQSVTNYLMVTVKGLLFSASEHKELAIFVGHTSFTYSRQKSQNVLMIHGDCFNYPQEKGMCLL